MAGRRGPADDSHREKEGMFVADRRGAFMAVTLMQGSTPAPAFASSGRVDSASDGRKEP
jgi:hypothetical protein